MSYVCPAHQIEMIAGRTKYGMRWQCPSPGCTVAQWDGSTSTPADDETRQLRNYCHMLFDPLWKIDDSPFGGKTPYGLGPQRRPSKGIEDKRSRAYRWLAACLGIKLEKCHFGMFDAKTCERAIRFLKKLYREKNYPLPEDQRA